jgi:hypothetical protein
VMKISELISALQKTYEEHGDVPVSFATYMLGIIGIDNVIYANMSPHYEGVLLVPKPE